MTSNALETSEHDSISLERQPDMISMPINQRTSFKYSKTKRGASQITHLKLDVFYILQNVESNVFATPLHDSSLHFCVNDIGKGNKRPLKNHKLH